MADKRTKLHLPYIDCVRGYAVLMVITSHLTDRFPELPYPLQRLTVTGWFGVQLFFLASCVTLMLSWQSEIRKLGSVNVLAFFFRRFLRIAPAYYAAGILYYFIFPPTGGFDGRQMITTMMFVNAWHPVWTPTVANTWNVVPGGWSIGVEFTFYLVFPIFAAWVTNLRRAIFIFGISVFIGVLTNKAALAFLSASYQTVEIDNFLYFWFPNQMSVFALGGILFFFLRKMEDLSTLRDRVQRNGILIQICAVGGFGALSHVPLGHYLGGYPYVPASLAVSLALAVFIVGLSTNRGLLINRYAAAIGQVSFSAYLLHFAVLKLFRLFPDALHTNTTGVGAILAFVLAWPAVVAITYVASRTSYRLIEQPMINLGRTLMGARQPRQVDAPT
jgi:peptidoglycan/LPS O-acetylase OafA/YrhL